MELTKENRKVKRTLRLVKSAAQPAAPRASHEAMLLAPGTSGYYRRIENYAHKIRGAQDVNSIVHILYEALSETRALNGNGAIQVDPAELARAERKIQDLTSEMEQLRELVHVDHLTGALNRGGLEQSFAREAARADRQNAPLGVALLDIDDFKHLNDRHGHQAGDAALVHLAQVIKRTVRPSDVVVRFGGEEFLFLLPDSKPDQAAKILNRLQQGLDRNPLVFGNGKLPFTFSAGVTVRKHGESRDAVIAHADRALYQAKRDGKHRVVTSA